MCELILCCFLCFSLLSPSFLPPFIQWSSPLPPGVNNLKERYWENYSLSWTFWYLVYNNDMINIDQLRTHFATTEQNPALKNLVDKYEKELTAITEMVTYFNRHPCIGYWYVYWSDVFKMNSDLPGIKNNSDMFNPSVSTSICFKPMGRKETEDYLSKCEGEAPLGKNQENHLDLLFAKIDAIKAKHPLNSNFGNPKKKKKKAIKPVRKTTDTEDVTIEMSETKVVDAVPKADPDGSAVWVDFAKSPVAESANPGNVTIVEDFSPGSAVWATK